MSSIGDNLPFEGLSKVKVAEILPLGMTYRVKATASVESDPRNILFMKIIIFKSTKSRKRPG